MLGTAYWYIYDWNGNVWSTNTVHFWQAKEEMAWQIAEMIVKDITSLTLSGGEETHCDPEL